MRFQTVYHFTLRGDATPRSAAIFSAPLLCNIKVFSRELYHIGNVLLHTGSDKISCEQKKLSGLRRVCHLSCGQRRTFLYGWVKQSSTFRKKQISKLQSDTSCAAVAMANRNFQGNLPTECSFRKELLRSTCDHLRKFRYSYRFSDW